MTNKSESSRDLTILVMSFISSFDIVIIVLLLYEGRWLDPKIFWCIPASAADAIAVNPKGIQTHLANGLISFFFCGNPILCMDQEVYQEILLIVWS